ncbi:phage infection protein [Sporosarcina luteola]|uniref:Phage infection protein n=1 Tax=Sporosarcina luteola TaxID=582850 RepID=A0A511ZBJ0_9BACL|nr:YhgE/Pip domain-containing protein [Sporosarcina luteola]GEN84815.1 phage infection protein [Sporosarcina luteola]
MLKSWSIFMTDVKNIGRNWVAAVLIGGLIFLPSLYAWLNIYASWDPYGKTSQLPVAVVNEDVGAEVRGERIDVGAELVETLKENRDMDWQFTTREQAMEHIDYGDYFAVLIIPEDFSEKLGSVISDHPEKAEIDYYVNEKINSIAPKITEKGASVIVEKVSSQFISTVNGVIFDLFNQLGIELQQDMPDIKQFEKYIFDIEKDLPNIHDLLKGTTRDAVSAQDLIHEAQGKIPTAKQSITDGLTTVNRALTFLDSAESRLNEFAPKVKSDLQKASAISKETNEFLGKVNNVKLDFTEVDRVKGQLDAKMTDTIKRISMVETDLQWLQDLSNSEEPPNAERQARLKKAIDETSGLQSLLEEAQANASSLNGLMEGRQQQLKQTLADLEQLSKNTTVRLDQFLNEYKNTIEPTVLAETARAKKTLQQAKSMLTSIQSTVPEVERILASTSKHITEGADLTGKALNEYPYIADKVRNLADRIRSIQGETDINEIIQLLLNDPQAERSFFEEPILLNENKLFPIENYGTGMTPFYTVLSIWVGCLLLISLLATDVENVEGVSSRQIYAGRLFTFLAIGLLQTIIVTVGDLTILGVHAENPAWFILFGLFISCVFMTIVYTLVSLFGDVGKALAIIMLVLQIAGSGGTYPVALLPRFFQWINPGLPFTYAIDLMREAVGGIVWQRVFTDVTFLLITGIVYLLIGLFLKRIVNRKTHQLLKKSRESGLFH